MPFDQLIKIVFLGIIIVGLGGLIFSIGYFAGDKNTLNMLQTAMPKIFGATFALVLVFSLFVYLYIRGNPASFIPFALILQFVTLEISLLAVSTATLQKT